MDSNLQDKDAEHSDFVGLAEKFGELFHDKIGSHVISAGAALNRTFAGGTKMQVRLVLHNKVMMVTFENRGTDSYASLTGKTAELTPCGLMSVEGKHGNVTAMFKDVCDGLSKAKDAESAVTRAQHFTAPSFKAKQGERDFQQQTKPSGKGKAAKRDRTGGSKQKTLQNMYYDALPSPQPVKKYPAKKTGKGVSHG